jgi:hypothetical protein
MRSDAASATLDLNGLLAIGLVGAGAAEIASIRRQLGPLPETTRDPDLIVEWVDRLSIRGPLRPLGREAAYGPDDFVVLRGRRKTSVRMVLPVDRIGEIPLTVRLERGARAIPYLLPLVNLTLLAKGTVPVHASAFLSRGHGTLVSGWAKGGKSEALLAFASHGATYVGDEWVFITADGSAMAGLPEPMRLWDWQIAMVPAIRSRIGLGRRARLALAAGVAGFLGGVARLPIIGATAPGDAARRLGALAGNQRSVQVPPDRVFERNVAAGLTRLDTVVLIETVSGPDSAGLGGGSPGDGIGDRTDGTVGSVETAEPGAAARRIAATTRHELLDVEALRLTFRYAFPDRPTPFLDGLQELIEERLVAALSGTRCIRVSHPFPPDIPALHDLMAPVVDGTEA